MDPREVTCSFWLFCVSDSVRNGFVSDSDGDGDGDGDGDSDSDSDSDSGSSARRVAVISSTVATVQECSRIRSKRNNAPLVTSMDNQR
jgi:hypothetical protein